MLNKKKFGKCEEHFLRDAGKFWTAFSNTISPFVLEIVGDLDEVKVRRDVRFYDTDKLQLRKTGYVFRERVKDDKKPQVTLKFRHSDRYLGENREILPTGDFDPDDIKFEEDIKALKDAEKKKGSSKDKAPPFQSLFSYSAKQKIKKTHELTTIGDITELYEGVRKHLGNLSEDLFIEPVGNFTARETVLIGGSFQLDNKGDYESECGLIFWQNAASHKLEAVEMSFHYGNPKENYPLPVAKRAYEVFSAIQQCPKLADWIDPHAKTKTSLAYSKVA